MLKEPLELVMEKVVLVERLGIFDENEMAVIRSKAFLSCLWPYKEVCLPVSAVAVLAKKSEQAVRNWCVNNKIECYRDFVGWWEIPIREVVNLKRTNWNVDENISLDIKKVDF